MNAYFDWQFSPHRNVPEYWERFELYLDRGVDYPEGHPVINLFSETPHIVINKPTRRQAVSGEMSPSQVWLYFRNRQEWKIAFRIARIYRKWNRRSLLAKSRLPEGVPFVKLAGAEESYCWWGSRNTKPAPAGCKLLTNRPEAA